MRRIYILAATALVVGAVLSLLPGQTSAAANDRQHIALTPSSTELTIAPGQSAKGSVEVINQGTDEFKMSASVAPYHVEGIDYDPKFTPLPGTVDAAQWVQLHLTGSPTLVPHQLVHIDYTVQVPAGTQPGGYYAVIFAQTNPLKSAGGVVAHNRVGEILYLTVKGPVHQAGSVSAGALGLFHTSGAVVFDTLVRNTGGVHFKSTVTTTVKNLFGHQVYKSSEDRFVLPQTERLVSIGWSNRVPIGIYRVSRQATVPQGTVRLPSKVIVMIQPWVVVVITVAILLLILALIRKLLERKKPEPQKKE